MSSSQLGAFAVLAAACLCERVPGVGAYKWLIEYDACDGK